MTTAEIKSLEELAASIEDGAHKLGVHGATEEMVYWVMWCAKRVRFWIADHPAS